MSTKEIKKPVLRPSILPSETSDKVIDYSFVSGPERKKNRITVTLAEYQSLLERLAQDKVLLEAIIKTWREYAAALREKGDSAEPPIGSYHGRFAELCDQSDANRGAILATVFGEKIESDLLYRFIQENNPQWLAEFSVERTAG